MLKYQGYLTSLFLIFVTGCTPIVRMPVVTQEPQSHTEENATTKSRVTGHMAKTRIVEEHYKLKPEPFSLDSNQSDPELLGPQSTLARDTPVPSDKTRIEKVESLPGPVMDVPPVPAPQKRPAEQPMTKEECIALIGRAKFDEYSRKFGGDAAAIRRCQIIQRLRKG